MVYTGKEFKGPTDDWNLVHWLTDQGFGVEISRMNEGIYTITAPGWSHGPTPPDDNDKNYKKILSKDLTFQGIPTYRMYWAVV